MPGPVPTDKVRRSGVAEVGQRRGRQARCISFGADDYDWLFDAASLGQTIGSGWVEAPLEHVALDNQGSWERALLSALGIRTDVDNQASLGHDAVELVRPDSMDPPARTLEEVGGRRAHAIAAPNW
jgi:hypothetical protein